MKSGVRQEKNAKCQISLNELLEELIPQSQSNRKEVSWLSALPIKAIGYALNKQEFMDAIQGRGVEGNISDFPKFPTPTFLKYLTPLHKGNEVWLLKSMEILVHYKKSLIQQKFQSMVWFNHAFL